VAVRQTIAWTPFEQWRMVADGELTKRADWRKGCDAVVRHGLSLEFLLYPWQDDDVARIAREYPETVIIIDHIASPIDQSPAGLERWRRAIDVLAAQPNVVIKLSAAAAYLSERTKENMKPFVQRVVSFFGAERVMFGSDFPVGKLTGWSFPRYFAAYSHALEGFSAAEKRSIFYDTAARVYRFT
jgi:predicted TIM-barrel fold metal-dependent hydrolase